jgi:microcin C transport system substrate-binding protein
VNKIWFYFDARQSPWGLYLNEDKDIFRDKNLRYAFAHAMNFEKINKELLRGEYYRLEHDYIGYGKYTNNNINARRFDLDKVDYYMNKSGWNRGDDGIWQKNGKKFSVEVTYSTNPLDTERLTILKEEAKKGGIELILDMLDGALEYKKVIEKKHEVNWMMWSTSYRPKYWEHYHSINAHKPQTNNITNTDNPELDILIEKYRASIEENERINLSLKIQEKLHEIGSFVPAFMIPYIRQGYWRWMKFPDPPGTKSSEYGIFDLFDCSDKNTGGLFWIDEKLHKETLKAMKKGEKFDPVTIKDTSYIMDIIKDQVK